MSSEDSERAMTVATLAAEIAKAIGRSKVPFSWGTLNDATQNECIEAARHVLKALQAHPDAVLAALGYEEVEWEWSDHGIGSEAALAHWQNLPDDPAGLRLYAARPLRDAGGPTDG